MNSSKALLIVIFVLSSFVLKANDSELNRLLTDRQKEIEYLQHLNDSAIPGRLSKLYLVNLQMEKILQMDESLALKAQSLAISGKALSDSLLAEEQRAAKLSLDNIQLNQKIEADAKMILILKGAVAVLLVIALLLVYFLARKKKPGSEDEKTIMDELSRLREENDSMKIKLEVFNNRYLAAQKEIENTVHERTAVLQDQLNEANEKYRSVLHKIERLIRDLSSVN